MKIQERYFGNKKFFWRKQVILFEKKQIFVFENGEFCEAKFSSEYFESKSDDLGGSRFQMKKIFKFWVKNFLHVSVYFEHTKL